MGWCSLWPLGTGPGGLAFFLFFFSFSCGEDGSLGPYGIGMSRLPALLPNRKTEKSQNIQSTKSGVDPFSKLPPQLLEPRDPCPYLRVVIADFSLGHLCGPRNFTPGQFSQKFGGYNWCCRLLGRLYSLTHYLSVLSLSPFHPTPHFLEPNNKIITLY